MKHAKVDPQPGDPLSGRADRGSLRSGIGTNRTARLHCTMRTEHGSIDRCPVCGAVVVDRFGPWPDKSAIPEPKPPEGATVIENRLVCSADSDHDLNPG